jgi:hypothetical protein
MKFLHILLISFFIFYSLQTKGQDSLSISTEIDSFQTPKYIGEHDYLFMSHESRKSMFKLDVPLLLANQWLRTTYERRLTKGLSLELGFVLNGLDDEDLFRGIFRGQGSVFSELRWYILKKNEMSKKRSNNNLDGLYLGVGYQKFFYKDKRFEGSNPEYSAFINTYLAYGKIGIQKMLLNNKFIDFGITLGELRKNYTTGTDYIKRFDFQWQMKYGWLLNGTKGKSSCEALRCFEEPKGLLKIDMVRLISEQNGNITHLIPNISYELKLATGFSLNTQILYDYYKYKSDSGDFSEEKTGFYIGLEPRWYPFMKSRIAKGKQADNFNGFYIAYNFNSLSLKQVYNDNGRISERNRSARGGFRHGPVIGFQQALAHNLFYDIRIDAYADQILDDTPQALNFKLGFAF